MPGYGDHLQVRFFSFYLLHQLDAIHMGSAATARRAASDIKLLTPLIYYLIRDMSDSSVSYRKVGQKKQFTALIDTSLDDQSLISTLSDLAGRAVEIVKD